MDFLGKYKNYADMVAGEWIKMRIEVHCKELTYFSVKRRNLFWSSPT